MNNRERVQEFEIEYDLLCKKYNISKPSHAFCTHVAKDFIRSSIEGSDFEQRIYNYNEASEALGILNSAWELWLNKEWKNDK